MIHNGEEETEIENEIWVGWMREFRNLMFLARLRKVVRLGERRMLDPTQNEMLKRCIKVFKKVTS